MKESDETIHLMAVTIADRLAAGEQAADIRLDLEALRGEFTGPEWRALLVAARLIEGKRQIENRH